MKKMVPLFILLAGCVSSGGQVANQPSLDCPPSPPRHPCERQATGYWPDPDPRATQAPPTYVCRSDYNPAFDGEPQDLSDLVRRRQELERQAKCKAQAAAQELE